MYIDHISGSLQNFNNSMRGLQNLAELDEQRRKRQLQASIEAKDRGDNPTAERLFLESQRGLLGNMFGSDSKEWEINNPYRGKEAGLQALIETPEQQQVQTLKDVNAIKQLKKIYGNNTEALNKQLGLMGLTQTPQDIISGYDQKVAQNKQISADNRRAEAYNKRLADIPKSYKGNESYQNQQILENAMNAISNAGTMQEKLENYNRYLTTGKAIADHYGHRFEAQPAAFFGIGSGGKGGKGEKPKPYNIIVDGDKIRVVGVTDSMLMDKDGINAAIIKRYPKLAKELNLENISFYLDPAGTDTGLNAKEREEQKQRAIETEAALEQKMRKDTEALDVPGIDTDYKEMRAYNESMDRAGIKGKRWDLDTYGIIPYESYIAKYGKSNTGNTANNEAPKKPWKK